MAEEGEGVVSNKTKSFIQLISVCVQIRQSSAGAIFVKG